MQHKHRAILEAHSLTGQLKVRYIFWQERTESREIIRASLSLDSNLVDCDWWSRRDKFIVPDTFHFFAKRFLLICFLPADKAAVFALLFFFPDIEDESFQKRNMHQEKS